LPPKKERKIKLNHKPSTNIENYCYTLGRPSTFPGAITKNPVTCAVTNNFRAKNSSEKFERKVRGPVKSKLALLSQETVTCEAQQVIVVVATVDLFLTR